MSRNSLNMHRVTVTAAVPTVALGGTDKNTVQFPTSMASKKIAIWSFRYVRVAGAAANYLLRGYNVAAGASEDESQFMRCATSVVGLGITFFNVEAPTNYPLIVKLDANARLYLQPNPDAGVNNTFAYHIDYEPCDPNVTDT